VTTPTTTTEESTSTVAVTTPTQTTTERTTTSTTSLVSTTEGKDIQFYILRNKNYYSNNLRSDKKNFSVNNTHFCPFRVLSSKYG